MKMRINKSDQIIKEFAASRIVDEDKLKTFLDFYDFLGKNKLGIVKTGRVINGSWAINYKNKKIGHFGISNNSFRIDYFDLFPRNKWFEKCEKHLSAELKDLILTHISTTGECCVKGICHSIENKNILGKIFLNRVCACRPIVIISPDGKTLEYAKELVLIGKTIIAEAANNK